MSDDSIQELTDRLIAEAELRDRFRDDPVAVVAEFEIELDDDQEERLTAEEWLEKDDDEFLSILTTRGLGFWF
jgi:hypothetical protein